MNAPLTGLSFAITRPTEQAKKLAELIKNAGGTPIIFPLIEITMLDDYVLFDRVISEITQYDWAIFISSNAVQNSMPRLIQKFGLPEKLKFAAIGPITADELKNFGIKSVLTPQNRFDSEALLQLPEMQDVENKKIIIFRGVGGRELLADTLKQRGAIVNFAECYKRINPQNDCKILEKQWIDKKLHGIVVTSSEAMRHLIDLAGKENWLKKIPIFVNHARIAEQSLSLDLQIYIAKTAGDEAMLQILISTLSPQGLHK